jgi:hypothetical protein
MNHPHEECIWTVILNWQCPHETCTCLEALLRSVDARTVLVIDNGSDDDSVALIQRRFPQVRLLPLVRNFGFARAVNIGIRQALNQGASAVFLLNNDAQVTPEALPALAAALFQSERRGIVSAKVLLADDPARLWAVGGVYREWPITRISRGEGERDEGQYDSMALDFVYGCAMLLRASMLRHIGCFDERFFVFYEDVDLCLRARAAGYEVALVPHALVYHQGGRSTASNPALRIFHMARSRVLFFSKHLPPRYQWRFYLNEVYYLAVLMVRSLWARKPDEALAQLHGRLSALAGSSHAGSGRERR